MSIEKAIPRFPLKLIFPSSLFPEPPELISPLSPGSPNILSLPSLNPTLPPSLSLSQICLCFSLTSRCPLTKKQRCLDSQDTPESSILTLMVIILYCYFIISFHLAVMSLSASSASLSLCHAPAQTSTMTPYDLWPQVQTSLSSCPDPPKRASTWVRQFPHHALWEIYSTLLSLHFLFCKMGIAVPILRVYDKDTMRRGT